MRSSGLLLAALALALLPRAHAEDSDMPEAPVKPGAYRPFTSSRGGFACDVPTTGWPELEEESPWGVSSHFFGPGEEGGRWRAALHVLFMDKAQPGFVSMDEAVKRERRSDASAERGATPVRRSRVAKKSARRFEVLETRVTPADRLPASPSVLHHYYAFVPTGDGYYVIELSSSRETYLDYRDLFERVLQTFRILGAG